MCPGMDVVVGLSGASAEFLGLRLFLEGFFLQSRDGLGLRLAVGVGLGVGRGAL